MLFKILFTAVFGIVGILFFVVGILGTRDSLRRLRRYKSIRLTPTDGLTGDEGKVVGTVMPRDDNPLVRAPVSGADCVAYHLRVEGLRPQVMEDESGRRVKTRVMRWELVFERVVADDLELADRAGQVAIDMAGAKELDIHRPDRTVTREMTVNGESWRRLEEEFPEFERMPEGRYRATERRIQVGDTLLAAGAIERAGRRSRLVRREEPDTVYRVEVSAHVQGRGRPIRTRDRDAIVLTDQTDADVTKRLRNHVLVTLAIAVGPLALGVICPVIVWLVF